MARALAEAPALSDALRRGQLGYSVARALTRVAEAALGEGLGKVMENGVAGEGEGEEEGEASSTSPVPVVWRRTERGGRR